MKMTPKDFTLGSSRCGTRKSTYCKIRTGGTTARLYASFTPKNILKGKVSSVVCRLDGRLVGGNVNRLCRCISLSVDEIKVLLAKEVLTNESTGPKCYFVACIQRKE
jgi:hypothetical protein